MKKVLFFAVVCMFTATVARAQVTVGSLATPRATLDVVADSTVAAKPDGLIPPRISASKLAAKDGAYSTAQHGSIVYVNTIDVTGTGKRAKVTKTGFYYYDAVQSLWIPLGTGNASWYYLPSTKIDVQYSGSTVTKKLDIFAAYKEQVSSNDNATSGSFGDPPTSYNDRGHSIASTGAPSLYDYMAWDPAYTKTDFYYYVVGYDERVFDAISIDVNGVMQYDVKGTADEATFINIVIVKK
jgi:hypothetical protein